MKQKWFSALLSFLLILIVATASAKARQVVTEEVRSWAKEALEQEKALKTISTPNTVAILYFYNNTEWSNLDLLQKGLAIMLMTDLSKVEEIQVVERVKMQALVEELDLGVSGLVESETASRVGRLLGAEHLVGGEIIKGKINKFKLKSSLLEVPTQEVFGEPMVEGELLAELFRMEKELLFEIVEELKIRLSPEQEAELRKPLTDNLSALLYLFQGIEQSDLGNYQKAGEFYQMASAQDPGLGEAEDFLRELIDLGLGSGEPYAFSEPEAYSEPESGDELEPDGDERPDQKDPTDRRDSDDDGRPDTFDSCPNDPNKTEPGICGCGVPDTDSDGDGTLDCNDGCPNDPNKTEPGICGCGIPEGSYTQGDYPPIVDELSLSEAQNNINYDDELAGRVDNGEFLPGTLQYPVEGEGYPGWGYKWSGAYEPGLQTLGWDWDPELEQWTLVLFTNPETLDQIKNDTFLAYAVQVEEDRLNTQILDMAERGNLLEGIEWQLQYGDIRTRDDFLLQKADAQSGRVLKDSEGNWVRVQQYILRPDNSTVQLLNVCLRGVGDHAGLSTMDFTTKLAQSYTGDLRTLPWNDWLDTRLGEGGRYVDSPAFNMYEEANPELASMYVKFTNPGNESLKEQRWFDPRPSEGDWVGDWQDINSEQLTVHSLLNGSAEYNNKREDGFYVQEYEVHPGGTDANPNPEGFNYVSVGNGSPDIDIKLAFHVVGDIDTVDEGGSIANINDAWDALRVNEGDPNDDAEPYIGSNNLEIAIDSNMTFFTQPIDVVYIPMSRMLWKYVGE